MTKIFLLVAAIFLVSSCRETDPANKAAETKSGEIGLKEKIRTYSDERTIGDDRIDLKLKFDGYKKMNHAGKLYPDSIQVFGIHVELVNESPNTILFNDWGCGKERMARFIFSPNLFINQPLYTCYSVTIDEVKLKSGEKYTNYLHVSYPKSVNVSYIKIGFPIFKDLTIWSDSLGS